MSEEFWLQSLPWELAVLGSDICMSIYDGLQLTPNCRCSPACTNTFFSHVRVSIHPLHPRVKPWSGGCQFNHRWLGNEAGHADLCSSSGRSKLTWLDLWWCYIMLNTLLYQFFSLLQPSELKFVYSVLKTLIEIYKVKHQIMVCNVIWQSVLTKYCTLIVKFNSVWLDILK